MNKVILMGNLTRDPEIRYATGESQTAVVRFSVAVQRKFQSRNGNGNDVDFINCVAFGRTGENIGKFFTKGRKIAVSGRLQVSNWEDNNGQKRVSTDVVVEDFDFCDKKSDVENNGSFNGAGASSFGNAPASNSAAQSTNNEKFYDMPDDMEDEDLPF